MSNSLSFKFETFLPSQEFDQDKNGSITAEEFRQAMHTKWGVEMNIDQVRELIHAVDLNENGELEYNGKSTDEL